MNRSTRTFLHVVLVLVGGAAAVCRADQPASNMQQQCPGVARWNKAHPEALEHTERAMALRDAARTLSDPALKSELEQRVGRDQEARLAWLAAPGDRATARALDVVDADNLAWLESLVRERGFPTAQQVGEAGIHDAWLLLQHADRDPQLQAAMLPALVQRHAAGELPPNDLARLTDRVLRAQHQPQRYGTQFPASAWLSNRFVPPDGVDAAAIDARRAELGLMPLADYACMMSVAKKGKR